LAEADAMCSGLQYVLKDVLINGVEEGLLVRDLKNSLPSPILQQGEIICQNFMLMSQMMIKSK